MVQTAWLSAGMYACVWAKTVLYVCKCICCWLMPHSRHLYDNICVYILNYFHLRYKVFHIWPICVYHYFSLHELSFFKNFSWSIFISLTLPAVKSSFIYRQLPNSYKIIINSSRLTNQLTFFPIYIYIYITIPLPQKRTLPLRFLNFKLNGRRKIISVQSPKFSRNSSKYYSQNQDPHY